MSTQTTTPSTPNTASASRAAAPSKPVSKRSGPPVNLEGYQANIEAPGKLKFEDLPEVVEDPYSIPLEDIDPSRGELFFNQWHWKYFERLRKEDPIHYTRESFVGPFWSITKFNDIITIETNHKIFSSSPSIVLGDNEANFQPKMFIASDPPVHDVQRKAVNPAVSPARLSDLEALIRKRVCTILDSLPIGEEFNWVEKVSIELTTQMLATLFDVPFEDRYLLPYWSDVTTSAPSVGNLDLTAEKRQEVLLECLAYFTDMWRRRANEPQKFDFISLLSHNEDTRNMVNDPMELMGNLMLLIVGGNDTTRNSISGGVYALNKYPEEYAKLKADPDLIPNMVSEIIRWQTPLAHMRRVCLEDFEIGGKTIKAGDKVALWYISGNRDEDVIPDADRLIIDRPRARHHVSFGFGIHRCMGNRVGEMQLRILWEEIMKRFEHVEVTGEPERVFSSFVQGYTHLPVVLHAKK